jgi:hypothetical protein
MLDKVPVTSKRVLWATSVALLTIVLVVAPGCRSKDQPKTEKRGAVESTGNVQAAMPPLTTGTVGSTASAGATGTGSNSTSSAASGSTNQATKPRTATPAIWPAKVAKFATAVRSPIWYPKSLPAGWKVDSVDVVELDVGTGLVCNIVFLKGDKGIVLTQGSPKQRSYDIVSSGRIPWGSQTADVVHQDPSDPTSPVIIVYNSGGNFAELQGDPSVSELKAIAKGMVLVK